VEGLSPLFISTALHPGCSEYDGKGAGVADWSLPDWSNRLMKTGRIRRTTRQLFLVKFIFNPVSQLLKKPLSGNPKSGFACFLHRLSAML
jgi:uncharacterized membrane protein